MFVPCVCSRNSNEVRAEQVEKCPKTGKKSPHMDGKKCDSALLYQFMIKFFPFPANWLLLMFKKISFPTRSRTWNLLVPTGSGYVIVARRLDHWAMRNEA